MGPAPSAPESPARIADWRSGTEWVRPFADARSHLLRSATSMVAGAAQDAPSTASDGDRRSTTGAGGRTRSARFRHRVDMVAHLLVAALLAFTASGLAAAEWTWPVEPPRAIIRAFLGPPEPWRPGHRGIDIAAPSGLLLAPADGVVRYAGIIVDRGVLSIDHGHGTVSSYEPVVPLVAAGDAITRGQAIARISAGHCEVACVHVGVRVDGEYRNPLGLLGAGWPVLLPTQRLGMRGGGPNRPSRLRRADAPNDSPRGASRC